MLNLIYSLLLFFFLHRPFRPFFDFFKDFRISRSFVTLFFNKPLIFPINLYYLIHPMLMWCLGRSFLAFLQVSTNYINTHSICYTYLTFPYTAIILISKNQVFWVYCTSCLISRFFFARINQLVISIEPCIFLSIFLFNI